MNTTKKVLGIIVIVISGIMLIYNITKFSFGIINEDVLKDAVYSIVALIIGIILLVSSPNTDKAEFEAYKRMKQQEQAMLYRYANAKGKPITEYLMDDRTKLITYYDRLPQKYKQQLLERADILYRRFESEQYTNNKK